MARAWHTWLRLSSRLRSNRGFRCEKVFAKCGMWVWNPTPYRYGVVKIVHQHGNDLLHPLPPLPSLFPASPSSACKTSSPSLPLLHAGSSPLPPQRTGSGRPAPTARPTLHGQRRRWRPGWCCGDCLSDGLEGHAGSATGQQVSEKVDALDQSHHSGRGVRRWTLSIKAIRRGGEDYHDGWGTGSAPPDLPPPALTHIGPVWPSPLLLPALTHRSKRRPLDPLPHPPPPPRFPPPSLVDLSPPDPTPPPPPLLT